MTAIVKSGPVEGRKLLGPDMKKPGWLGDVAFHDPHLAYSLLQSPVNFANVGINEPSCGAYGWESLNIIARFESGAANQTIKGRLNGTISADLWIRQVMYTVRRPNAFAGSIFKAQSDFFNAKNPNIDMTFIVKSYCRYTISPDPMPLENIEQVFECVCPVGMVLGCASTIELTFQNLRALAEDEIPTEVIVTLHGIRLPMRYASCTLADAVAELKACGCL